MGFAFPTRENRLTVSALITPTSEPTNIGRIIMLDYLWVAIGGAIGSVARFWISDFISDAAQRPGSVLPWGTLVVNVSGSFVIGFLFAFTEPGGRRMLGPGGKYFFMYGLCGGYTTFSAFSLQTLELLRSREWFSASGNIVLSVGLCLLAVWLGFLLGTLSNAAKGN
jgi:fluoride exporter